MLQIAEYITLGLGIYTGLGLLFGLYFVTWGIRGDRVQGLSLILRLMLLPGAVLLWPVLIAKRKPS